MILCKKILLVSMYLISLSFLIYFLQEKIRTAFKGKTMDAIFKVSMPYFKSAKYLTHIYLICNSFNNCMFGINFQL